MPVLLDSFTEGYRDGAQELSSSYDVGCGVTFYATASSNIYSAWFYSYKVNSPTGTAYAKLYSVSGTTTPGVDGKPGTLLQTSSGLDVTTLSPDWPGAWVEWRFAPTGSGYMNAGTRYFISLEYSGGGAAYIVQGHDLTSPPRPSDNYADTSNGVDWYASTARYAMFKVYGDPAVMGVDITSSNPAVLTKSGVILR